MNRVHKYNRQMSEGQGFIPTMPCCSSRQCIENGETYYNQTEPVFRFPAVHKRCETRNGIWLLWLLEVKCQKRKKSARDVGGEKKCHAPNSHKAKNLNADTKSKSIASSGRTESSGTGHMGILFQLNRRQERTTGKTNSTKHGLC